MLFAEERQRARDERGAPGWVGAERHPPLLEEEKDESAKTRGSDGAGALVERLKRRGGEAISVGRRDMCARIEDALRASTVVQYNMSAFSSPVFPTYYRSVRKRRGRGGTAPSLSRADGVTVEIVIMHITLMHNSHNT